MSHTTDDKDDDDDDNDDDDNDNNNNKSVGAKKSTMNSPCLPHSLTTAPQSFFIRIVCTRFLHALATSPQSILIEILCMCPSCTPAIALQSSFIVLSLTCFSPYPSKDGFMLTRLSTRTFRGSVLFSSNITGTA
jgi:hypothetical protein